MVIRCDYQKFGSFVRPYKVALYMLLKTLKESGLRLSSNFYALVNSTIYMFNLRGYISWCESVGDEGAYSVTFIPSICAISMLHNSRTSAWYLLFHLSKSFEWLVGVAVAMLSLSSSQSLSRFSLIRASRFFDVLAIKMHSGLRAVDILILRGRII